MVNKFEIRYLPISHIKTQINDNGLLQGLIQPPTMEELSAFVNQLDQTHWQHELQVLSAMSVNRILKVTATQLWLQSCTSVSEKPVKFTQLVKNTSVTAVLVNVHPFISMEADERITTAERILTFHSETRTMEPSRSVKINLSMKSVPTEMRINFLGKFFVGPFVTKPVRCYRCQRFGHLAAACLAKKERCSMCSGHHRTQQCLEKIQNSESVDLKCANCGEKHSANSNHCSVLQGKHAAENEQCNVTHTCHQTISATTSYIDGIPSCIYRGHRHQEESHVRHFSQRSQQLCSCCCKTSCSEVCGVSCTLDIQVCSLKYQSTVSLMHGSKHNLTEQQSIKMDQ